jgi:hypothetical protein
MPLTGILVVPVLNPSHSIVCADRFFVVFLTSFQAASGMCYHIINYFMFFMSVG